MKLVIRVLIALFGAFFGSLQIQMSVGLAGLTFHSLRHSWASWQSQGGTTPRVMHDLGGWKSTQMPNHYTHLDPGFLAGFADRSQIPGGEGVTKSVTLKRPGKKKRVSACLNGKGGTRTRREDEENQ